ncbi:hypothetical protein [Telmatospirillum sp.]|uniref:hypothetical protein n=1 Tax=Telmatospirillum sp. TaxID=2079197 RepID=UPI002848C8AB|nr:hypothetical protein [Telmatospirillum sp.]MDR3440733.1 hypothetical protein [Telmatospirillum sp.]
MTDEPDLEQLARRYLDLWQEQAAAVINDPVTADAMGRAYAIFGKGLASFLAAVVPPDAHAQQGATDTADHAKSPGTPAATSGAAPVVAASDGAGFGGADLAARVAELEERILRLETAIGASGRNAAPATGKRRR